MRSSQKGFAVLETLLILVIIGTIGGIGWYAIHTKHQTDKILSQADKISQSSISQKTSTPQSIKMTLSSDVSFNAPSGWQSASPAAICNGTDNPTQCTDSAELSPVDAKAAMDGNEFGVSVGRYSNKDNKSAKSWLFDTWCGCIEVDDWSDQAYPLSGYDAVHASQKNSQYVDEYYVIRKQQVIVLITARTKDTSTTAVQTGTAKDYTKYNTQIKQIAASVKIVP